MKSHTTKLKQKVKYTGHFIISGKVIVNLDFPFLCMYTNVKNEKKEPLS
jgi:hypothetical protein